MRNKIYVKCMANQKGSYKDNWTTRNGVTLQEGQPTKQTSKQNITRDIEIKNKLTVTRGEVGGDNGGKRGRVFQEHL